MRIGILFLFILFTGCNSEDISISPMSLATTTTTSTTTTTTINKSTFSQWDETGSPGKRLPFSSRSYNNTFRDTIFLIDLGTQCICDMLITPNPSGTITFSACSGTGCSGIANTYTWTNSGSTLTLCEFAAPSVCTSYN